MDKPSSTSGQSWPLIERRATPRTPTSNVLYNLNNTTKKLEECKDVLEESTLLIQKTCNQLNINITNV